MNSEGNMIINQFVGEYRFLSNFFISPMRIYSPIIGKEIVFQTNEHLYQSAKTSVVEQKLEIINAPTAGKAKKLGRKVTMRSDWEQIKYPVMLYGVRTKYSQNHKLNKWLLNTNGIYLIEGNHWHDNTWGDCWCNKCINIKGLNWLGEILMKVREENLNTGRL